MLEFAYLRHHAAIVPTHPVPNASERELPQDIGGALLKTVLLHPHRDVLRRCHEGMNNVVPDFVYY